MPNGVICGGAVDGSNQLGGMVTCQAMTARPDGAGAPAVARPTPRATTAANSNQAKVPRRRWMLRDAMSAEILVAAAKRTAICPAEVRWHARILSSEQPSIAALPVPLTLIVDHRGNGLRCGYLGIPAIRPNPRRPSMRTPLSRRRLPRSFLRQSGAFS